MSTDTEAILSGVRTWAENNDVPVDSIEDAEIVVTLPGEKKLKTNVASREGVTLQALLLQEEAAALAQEEIAANCAAGYELIGAFLECKNQLEEVDKIADCLHKINVVMAGLRV